jgi:hypothetical protein
LAISDRDTLPPPDWQPKSDFFKWVWARAKERKMAERDAWASGVQIGICGACGAMFGMSPDRQWSGCHGSDPVRVFDIDNMLDLINMMAEQLMQGNPGRVVTASSQPPAAPPGESPVPTGPTAPSTPDAAGGTNTQGETAAASAPSNGASVKPDSPPPSPRRQPRRKKAPAAAAASVA